MVETNASPVEDRPSSRGRAVGTPLAALLGGAGWLVLTPLEPRTTGVAEHALAYGTEPAVAFCALLGVYGFARRHEADLLGWGRAGYLTLLAGFSLVGVPAALDGIVVSVPGLWLLLGQPDSILFTTLAGALVVYAGFLLLGLDARRRDHAFGRHVTRTFLLAGPLAVAATGVVIAIRASPWATTAVTAPAGLGLLALGYVLFDSSAEPGAGKRD